MKVRVILHHAQPEMAVSTAPVAAMAAITV
jgi:hypothetical protein